MKVTSPLIQDAKDKRVREVQRRLVEGMHPDSRDTNGETALTWAAQLGHTAVVKDLLAAGADLEVRGNLFGATPLLLAARGGHRGIVALLAVRGDVNARDDQGATALMAAVDRTGGLIKPQSRVLSILQTLIEAGTDLDAQDLEGETAIMWAVRARNMEALELLLEAGADAHIENLHGETAVDIADGRGDVEMVNLIHKLIQRGS